MNRSAATAYLATEYGDIASDSQLDEATLATIYGAVIDRSLKKLGFTESALAQADVTETDSEAYYALLDYYTLGRFARLYATRVDTTVPNLTVARNQAYRALSTEVDKAAARCAALGYPVDGAGMDAQMTSGFLNLDFLEPSTAEGEFA